LIQPAVEPWFSMQLVDTATLPELGKQLHNNNPRSQSVHLFVTILILYQFFEI